MPIQEKKDKKNKRNVGFKEKVWHTCHQSTWRRRDRIIKLKYLKSTAQEFSKINEKCLTSYI